MALVGDYQQSKQSSYLIIKHDVLSLTGINLLCFLKNLQQPHTSNAS